MLSEVEALEVLRFLHEQVKSVRKPAEKLGTGKPSLPGNITLPRIKLCEVLPPEGFIKILKGKELLEMYGILEGRLNKPLAFALLDAMM